MADEMPKPHVGLLQQLIDEVLAEEVTRFQSDPMIVEFGIACKFLADIIKKTPQEVQPVLLAALIAAIEASAEAATALVESFPTVIIPLDFIAGEVKEVPGPASLTQLFIMAQGALLDEYVTQEVYG